MAMESCKNGATTLPRMNFSGYEIWKGPVKWPVKFCKDRSRSKPLHVGGRERWTTSKMTNQKPHNWLSCRPLKFSEYQGLMANVWTITPKFHLARHDTSRSAFEMTYIVSSGALNSTHSLTHSRHVSARSMCRAHASWRCRACRTARLDTMSSTHRVESCRDVTNQEEFVFIVWCCCSRHPSSEWAAS